MDSTRLRSFVGAALTLSTLSCTPDPNAVVLAGTTSTYDSGLIEHLVERLREDHPAIRVRTVIAGSAEILELGRRGDADVLLVHAPEAEERFIAAGHATERHRLMSNGFLIAGPPGDPAGIANAATPAAALARIASSGSPFVSRGDSSGTHYREVALWARAGIDPAGDWYIESGQSQATSLQVASERAAYTLTDGATFRVLGDILELESIYAGHDDLRNVYSLLQPRAALQASVGNVVVQWLLSERGRAAIAEFRFRADDVPLFTPWASEPEAPVADSIALEGESPAAPDSVRGSTARGSPTHHLG